MTFSQEELDYFNRQPSVGSETVQQSTRWNRESRDNQIRTQATSEALKRDDSRPITERLGRR